MHFVSESHRSDFFPRDPPSSRPFLLLLFFERTIHHKPAYTEVSYIWGMPARWFPARLYHLLLSHAKVSPLSSFLPLTVADACFSDCVHLVALFSEVNSRPISLSSDSLPSIICSSALEVDMSLLRRASFELASVALL